MKSLKINLKKIGFYKLKSAYFVLPVSFLLAIGVFASSMATNIGKAVDEKFVSILEQNALLIRLAKQSTNFVTTGSAGGRQFSFGGDDSNYTLNDLEQIMNIDGVVDAALVTQLPLHNIKATNLFEGLSFNIGQLAMLSETQAKYYVNDEFTYIEGEPVPIILNANSFIESYEDWSGKDTLEVQLVRPGQGTTTRAEGVRIDSPVKSRSIDYDSEELIGRVFTMEIGGLDALRTYKIESDFEKGKVIFTKLTQAELDAAEQERKDAISTYWNYDGISKPMQAQFKVVGVIEDESEFLSYIPENYAEILMQKYIQNQLTNRTTTALDINLLNSTYLGLSYDGATLEQGAANFAGARAVFLGPNGGVGARGRAEISGTEITKSYTIPGLVVEVEPTESTNNSPFSTGTVVGEYTDATVFAKAARESSTIILEVEDIFKRAEVVSELNRLGYAYQDFVDSQLFTDLKNNLELARKALIVFFMVMVGVIVTFTIGKFVADGQKEIGIFRAIGGSKGFIRNLFLQQTLLLTLISTIAGLAVGVGAIYACSGIINNWFNDTVVKPVAEEYAVVENIGAEEFAKIDPSSIAIFVGILFVVSMLIAIIPSQRAANMHPVKAIKGD